MKPQTWVQVYDFPNFEPGPDGAPRKEFWQAEWMGTSWSRGSDPLPRFTERDNGRIVQEWRRVR